MLFVLLLILPDK